MGTVALNDRITAVMVAVGAQTDFPVDFPALKQGGVFVGLYATRVRGGATTTLSLADFSVVAPTDSNFLARLNVGAQAGDTYQFYGVLPPARDVAMVPGGAFVTETYEIDQVAQVAMVQELRRDVTVLQAAVASGGGGGGGGGDVTSVNGKTGVVVLAPADIGAAIAAHAHVIADVTGLQAALDGKAAAAHVHAVADVTGLQADLDGKSNVGHSHDAADIVSGLLNAARIPALDAAKITTGIFGAALIPDLDAGKITTGTIDPARLPASSGIIVASGDMTSLTAPQQAAIVAGTEVVLSDGTQWVYSGSGSKTSTASYTQLSINAAWAAITGKPANVTAFAALTGAADKLGYFTGSGAMALTSLTTYGRALIAAATADAASALVGERNVVNFRDYFGGVGDNATNNDTAFTAAEASAFERIWLPEGTFYTTKATSQLLKRYVGPGRIRTSAGDLLAGFAQLSTSPTFSNGTGSEYGEVGDIHFADMDIGLIRPGVRQQLSNNPPQYFQAGASRKYTRHYNRGGASGTLAFVATTAPAGQNFVLLNSVDGIGNGDVLGLMQTDGGAITDTMTVSAVDAVAKKVTFTGNLTHTYTVQGADYVPQFLTGYTWQPRVTKGLRTMNPYHLAILEHTGEGDSYVWCGRVIVDTTPKAGMVDVFYSATGGLIGGDLTIVHSGAYGTGWEMSYNDNSPDGVTPGADVAIAGFVNTYLRTNDAGAGRAFWVHDFAISSGTKPIEAFDVRSGKARVGLDLVLADFSSDGQRAIQLKTQQRIYFDGGVNTTPGQRARGQWGNVQGDSWIGHDSDGTSAFVDLWIENTRALRARPTSLSTPLQFNGGAAIAAATSVTAGTTLNSGGDAVIGGNANIGGGISANGNLSCASANLTGDIALQTGHVLYFKGVGGGTFICDDGNAVVIYRNGVLKASWA